MPFVFGDEKDESLSNENFLRHAWPGCGELSVLLKWKLKDDNSKDKCIAINCLEKLSLYLIRPYLLKKYNDTVTLRHDLKVGIAGILGLDVYKEGEYEQVNFRKEWDVRTARKNR